MLYDNGPMPASRPKLQPAGPYMPPPSSPSNSIAPKVFPGSRPSPYFGQMPGGVNQRLSGAGHPIPGHFDQRYPRIGGMMGNWSLPGMTPGSGMQQQQQPGMPNPVTIGGWNPARNPWTGAGYTGQRKPPRTMNVARAGAKGQYSAIRKPPLSAGAMAGQMYGSNPLLPQPEMGLY